MTAIVEPLQACS